MIIVAPIAALIIQLGISRQREFAADASGARMVGHPYGLISALEKLGAYNKRIPMDVSPSTASLFIVAPLSAGQIFSGPVQHAPAACGANCGSSQYDGHPVGTAYGSPQC